MAKTGSISFSYSQDTTKNQSTVTVSGIIKTTGESYRGDSRTGTFTIKQGNTILVNAEKFTHGAPANSTTTLFTKTVTVTHADDGTSGAITASYNYDSGWCTASGSLSLPTIARKSTLTVANGTLDTPQTLTISEKASAFNHKLSYKCGSASGYILGSASATSSSLSTSWKPPIDLALQNTTGTSVSITFTLQTYNGSALIGSNTYTKTFAIPEQLSDGTKIAPKCDIAVSDYMGYAEQYGGYVKNKSRLAVSVATEMAYNSAINSYSTSVNGTTYTGSSFVTEALKTAGDMTIASTVTDKRGRSGSDSETINVLDYAAPAVTYLSVHRCNADGAENEQGECVKVTYTCKATSLNFQNSVITEVKFKKTTEDNYTSQFESEDVISQYRADEEAIFAGADNESVLIFRADTESSYNVLVTITDVFETGTMSTTVSTARTLLDFYGDRAMAVGKVCEVDEGFEIGLPTFIRDGYPMNVHCGTPNQYDLIAKVDALEGGAIVELTQAEYNALESAGNLNSDAVYFISDAESTPYNASMVEYDNSKSELSADKVQGAIDELSANYGHLGDYMRVYMASNYSIQAKNTYEKLPMTTLAAQHGSTFQQNSDGSITVLRRCVVMVVGQVYFSIGFANNDWICSAIYINDGRVARSASTVHASSPYVTETALYIGIRSAGDKFDLRAINETGARGIIGNDVTTNFLLVTALS